MALDDVLKLIGAVISIVTVGKLVYDVSVSRKTRLRDDYKFAKEFFDELRKTPQPHPLVVERGYHAIAGDTALSVREMEYLLSLQNPSSALRDYVLARPYLAHLPESGHLQVKFKKQYSSAWSRRWRRGLYLVLYFFSALLAVSPMFFLSSFNPSPGTGLLILIVFGAAFGLPAYNALREYGRLYRGEKLVAEQKRHPQIIVGSQAIAQQMLAADRQNAAAFCRPLKRYVNDSFPQS